MALLRLPPREFVRLPGTAVMVRWDGDQEVTVSTVRGHWDLSRLHRPGRVMLWACLANRPDLGTWPIAPLAHRTTYPRPRA